MMNRQGYRVIHVYHTIDLYQPWKIAGGTADIGATEIAGQQNAGLEIDENKLQGVENDGHSIKG